MITLSKIRVSVVVPVYNSSASLERLLLSLVRQTGNNDFEVVIVDDGSKDCPEKIVEKFKPQLSLKFLMHQRNRGPAAARNTGIKAALGDIIVFTDADCAPEPDWLQKMVAPFADKEVTGVKGIYKTRQTDVWAQLAQLEFAERYELLESQSDIDFIDTYSGAYRRSDLLAVEGFSEDFVAADNEDVDLAFRVKKLGGRFVFVNDAAVFHTHREGLLNYAKLKFRRGFWRMKVYFNHPEKAIKDSYTPASLKAQLLLAILLPLAIFSKSFRFWWRTAWFFSCMPMLRISLGQRSFLAVLVPLFCLVRALSLITGMVAGIFRHLGPDSGSRQEAVSF